MVFHSEYADVPVLEAPIHDVVLGGAAAHGDTVALIDGTNGMSVTYAQLDTFHRRIAAHLAEAGLRKGDVLALHSPNTIAYPAVFYGATRAGAAVTTVHPLATAEEFAKQIQDSGARWIVTVSLFLDVARRAAELAGGVQEIYVCDRAEGHTSVLDMLGSTAPEPDIAFDADDVAVLPYSSGTTGTPKGVMLTHRSIGSNLEQLRPFIPMEPGQIILAVLPFFHIYGLTALLNVPLRSGATVVVLPRFDLDQFLGVIQEYRVTGLYVAPPIVLALAKHPAVDAYDLSGVEYIVSAAAPLDADLAAACAARVGVPAVLQAYGMTELSPGANVVPIDARDAPPGTVGKLLPNTELRITSLDTPGEDLGIGTDGEILIRGPQTMKGYLGRPDATAAMIDPDGWVHTGDVGRVDANGWLFVVDRVKELIKYKGYQVAPAELEALLLGHASVADAAVIGVPDPDGNEIPKAYVVRTPGADLTADALMGWVAERVAPYKKVREVEFIETVPRAVSGKILRRELREPRELRERADGR
ncbi:AMP-binding protein [Streptomyces sp. NPDC057509]|uniref:AMP-binding protein n=1 Tax=Streptomyces sp. NPDC057509 TaxID=3346152 RepID=UPI00368B493B